MIRAQVPLTLPPRAADPPAAGFPVIASLAPLAVAGMIWMITGSAFVLLFAILGPVIAVASMLDARRTNRRGRRRAATDEREALAALRTEISVRHDLLRHDRWQRTPTADSLAVAPNPGAVGTGTDGLVALGSGPVESGLRLEGGAGLDEHRELRDTAATLADAPITAEAVAGIGIAGPLPLTRALARGLLVQLVCGLPPDQIVLAVPPGTGWSWARALPRGTPGAAPRPEILVCEAPAQPAPAPAGSRMILALAPTPGELPWGCDTIVRVHGPGRAEILRSGRHARGLGFQPELVSVEQAASVAARLRERAAAAGLGRRQPSVPATVRLSDLPGHRVSGTRPVLEPGRGDGPGPSFPAGLSCPVGLAMHGEVSLDLVGAGPHAVVGGTTGSGKSELLVTWVAAMAAAFVPSEVTFLLVDFKGGAAFAPLGALPHCVGLITDLDGRQAARALASLAAELRHRERVLRGAGARDLVELGKRGGAAALPRLVIVVDEFATMLTAFPELHALFVDIAARGRSLGVHLILCTQRPNGVVRDALLANCTLRISLRVNNRADSVAVLGTDAAAALSAEHPGRCLIATAAGAPVLCQIATTSESEIRAIADRVLDHVDGAPALDGPAPRRPWLDVLPVTVTREDIWAVEAANAAESAESAEDAESAPSTSPGRAPESRPGPGPTSLLGLLDEPERQRYRVARYQPFLGGNLLVLGASRAGKTGVLASLAEQSASAPDAPCQVEFVPPHVEGVWDALDRARRLLDSDVGPAGRLLLIDDFDSVYARWDQDYRPAALELLAGLLRDGGEGGLRVVVAAQRLAGALQVLPSLCQNRLLLRLADVAEHVGAGGTAASFDDTMPAGGGTWQGHRIQLLCPEPGAVARCVALAARGAEAGVAEHLATGPDRTLLVVSGSPPRTAAAFRAAGGAEIVDLGRMTDASQLRATLPGAGTVFVGDVDAWQTHWSLLASLKPRAELVFDGCSLADYWMISRRRDLPPPLAPGRGRMWAIRPDGTVRRAVLPAGS
ncbi:FtsK/SpoIIIE domain-containing protein [Cryobacterium sp. TMT4-10]|uniref:FtsK/SpoIIIE domain-containing protein n=1 Tax=Cryobacterium sp. TMT4-10 TaxID=1259256 RepID=UPI00106CEAE4|nr:FtsK/SpoIIIE domain-containing protein [Cryobacterium sp. TMT4-10]TFD19677.1 hypothetical protein E3T42_03795 [Cryobacterium sp. TMT4-10]